MNNLTTITIDLVRLHSTATTLWLTTLIPDPGSYHNQGRFEWNPTLDLIPPPVWHGETKDLRGA